MKEVYLALLFTVCICDVFLVTGIEGPQCFQYTWRGARSDEKDCPENEEKYQDVPCIEPIMPGKDKPNTAELWYNLTARRNESLDKYFCSMEKGDVCVRYTYMYNSAVVNVSYFCGKVIEDKTTAVESGCFVHYTEGYIIEACACLSVNGTIPCNSTRRNMYSILITFMATAVPLFIYKTFNIP
ncbi:uncharacterized protein [Linepithema humile]|uniref:uncharacterized protein n=1 Tax=Linepithema humile TaxID=83485 RepID=UPI0006231CD8|nr:PREDICTED: uncharacterized protein LOC105678583 [Linepithema humile]